MIQRKCRNIFLPECNVRKRHARRGMPRSVSVPDIFHKGTAPRGLAPSAPTISGALSPSYRLPLYISDFHIKTSIKIGKFSS